MSAGRPTLDLVALTWTGQLDDLAVRRAVGSSAFLSGAGYVQRDCVSDLTVAGDGRLLSASVQGTQLIPYHVVVTPRGRAGEWSGFCTCRVGANCKHVAAVLLAARRSREGTETSPRPAWEGPIAALVQARAASEVFESPLALQLEVVGARAPATGHGPRRAAPGAMPRVRIRPVIRGRSGKWVRTGVSWRDLQQDYGRPTHAVAHREVLRAFFATYLAGTGSYYGYGPDAVIHLDDIGPSLWPLLARAAEAGVELVSALPSDGPVAVLDPADFALDLRRPEGSTCATLEPVVTLCGHVLGAAGVEFLGSPPHGLFVTDAGSIEAVVTSAAPDPAGPVPGLVLAPLAERLDEHVAGLLRTGQRWDIPATDLPRFLQVYYPGLRAAVVVTSTDDTVTLPEVLPPRLALTASFRPDHEVNLEWAFAYRVGDDEARVPLDGPDAGAVTRDRRAEQRLLEGLDPRACDLIASTRCLTGIGAVAFTQDLLPDLAIADDVELQVIGEPPEFRLADMPPVVHLSTTDASDDPDWFDLGVAVSVAGEEIPFDELFTALAGDQTHLVLHTGTYFSLDRPEFDQLHRLIEEARALQDRESDGLRVSVFQAGLWEELLELGIVETQSQRWAAAVQGLLDVEEVAPPPVPAGFEATLRPYQLDGYQWLTFLWQHRLGGILADDMGLGKTIQTLAMICHAREAGEQAGPFLVVAPTSVVGNWAQEATRFAPGLKVRTVTETTARRGTPLAEDVDGADLVITSYALFRIDAEAYRGLPWAGLILDEAQFVKNHQAQTYQCARKLPAPFKLAITGTPMENSLMDLWSLLSIVAPGLFPSPTRFAEVYRRPIERGDAPELLSTLRRRIRPLMRRRTKDQVVAELPPKQEQVLEVALNPRHQKVYQTHLQRERQKVLGLLDDLAKNRFVIFRSLTLLRQLSLDPGLVDPSYADIRSSKADAFIEQIREVVSEGHRALVFSQFTGFLRVIRDRLDAEGIAHCYLDGRTRKRAERIAEFKTGAAPVFLISLKAGGVGLNLTEADYCFILDPWWNPAVEAQAVDRTHRIGQDKPVMVYRLVAAGTIEEKVMELKARKQSLFDRVMDDGALLSAPLSVEDIKGLFG